jgi:predicted metal-binding protein
MFITLTTSPNVLIFNEKVRDLCRSCKRFGKSAACPPNIESLDHYRKAAKQYKHMDIVYKEFNVNDYKDKIEAGKKSSLELYKHLVDRRNKMIQEGNLFVTCYGGGSCKICKNCTIPCTHPEKSIIPIEGTGVNIFETLRQFDIILPSIIDKTFFRIGVILYD